jgi:hypothetical protein
MANPITEGDKAPEPRRARTAVLRGLRLESDRSADCSDLGVLRGWADGRVIGAVFAGFGVDWWMGAVGCT